MDVINLKQALQLIRNLKKRKKREKLRRFLIEGINFVEEAFKSNVKMDCLVYTEKILEREKGRTLVNLAIENNIPIYLVGEQIFKEITETETPQGILAVGQELSWDEDELLRSSRNIFVALDEIQDPGNLGTIIRTGDGVGINGIFLSKGTVDLYNPKVLRATMGSIFRVPVFRNVNLFEFFKKMKNRGFSILAAVPHRGVPYYEASLTHPRIIIVIGNEARGINSLLLDQVDTVVNIPLRAEVESLNAAVAAGLILYEIQRQNKHI